MDRKVTWNGKDYAWKDHPGGAFVLDMIHVSAKVSKPEPVPAGKVFDDGNERPSHLQAADEYWLVTLTLITRPGFVADFMLPQNYPSVEAAMSVAENHVVRERQRAVDLFGIHDTPDPEPAPESGSGARSCGVFNSSRRSIGGDHGD